MPFNWLDQIDRLTQANLTIKEQVRTNENPAELRYRALFPRVATDSIKISEISKVDFRPNGGRREWNADGREIPEKMGPARDYEMVPINPTHHINEREMQKFGESGIQELLRRNVIKSVESWPTALADASEVQAEADAFDAWFNNAITVMDPKTARTVSVGFGYDAGRYITAGTIWTDPGQDAFQNLLTYLQNAQNLMGTSIGGIRMRRAVVNAIIADAPAGAGGVLPTFSIAQERVRAEGFANATFVIDERTYDKFTGAGSATTPTYYVPAGKIAFQPASGRVGNTHVAPVVRAYDFLSGGNRALANGIVILRSEQNSGKTLLIEAQQNLLTIPDENLVYVVDTLIT